MGVPCLTLRDSTERPETVSQGTNELIGTNPKSIPKAMKKLFSNNWKKGSIPKKWDGKTSQRIINTLTTNHRLKDKANKRNTSILFKREGKSMLIVPLTIYKNYVLLYI